MAAGEWISVTSQVELFNGVLNDLKRLVQTDRDLLVEQLELDFKDSGISPKTSMSAAKEIAISDEHLYNQYAANVIEINPNELGSPWTAASSSLMLFTAGALVALVPWFFTSGSLAILLSIVFTGVGGLAVGAYVARSSGNSVYRGALRQLLIIIFASLITYGVGHIFGRVVS
jgi:VIT1/CCC1 family predicted Fe2+/Mn2+ transporter